MTDLWLDPIPLSLRAQALFAFEDGQVEGFLRLADSEQRLALVVHNRLLQKQLYEVALLDAFLGTGTNHHRWSLAQLRFLFAVADRTRLRAINDPLPGGGPYTVYRGVAGHGRVRRIMGVAWTGSLERARKFAEGYVGRLPNPAVYCVVVDEPHVLYYANQLKREQEFLVLLPHTAKALLVGRIA